MKPPPYQPALIALIFAVITSMAAEAASFQCAKAIARAEVLVCKDAALATLDEHLGRYYAAANMALGEAATCLKTDQRNWLRAVRDACTNGACLKDAYLRRLAELDALQPGATSIRHLALPDLRMVPSLVWIIAPEKDTVAAPAVPNLRPLIVKGTVVDDTSKGDGYIIKTAKGTKHILLLSMFIDGANVNMLSTLAKMPPAEFEVRGFAEAGNVAVPHFAASRCRFIYRLAP
jgi:uncharacterized protein